MSLAKDAVTAIWEVLLKYDRYSGTQGKDVKVGGRLHKAEITAADVVHFFNIHRSRLTAFTESALSDAYVSAAERLRTDPTETVNLRLFGCRSANSHHHLLQWLCNEFLSCFSPEIEATQAVQQFESLLSEGRRKIRNEITAEEDFLSTDLPRILEREAVIVANSIVETREKETQPKIDDDQNSRILEYAEFAGVATVVAIRAVEEGLDWAEAIKRIDDESLKQETPSEAEQTAFGELDSTRLWKLPHNLSNERKDELSSLTAFTYAADQAVLNASRIFESVERCNQRIERYAGKKVEGFCRLWKGALEPVIEYFQIFPHQQALLETLTTTHEELAGFNHRLIEWDGPDGQGRTAEHWHHVAFYLAADITRALLTKRDAKEVLLFLSDKCVFSTLSMAKITSELERESKQALKHLAENEKPFSRDLDYHGENAVAYLNWAAIGTKRDIINWLPESKDGKGVEPTSVTDDAEYVPDGVAIHSETENPPGCFYTEERFTGGQRYLAKVFIRSKRTDGKTEIPLKNMLAKSAVFWARYYGSKVEIFCRTKDNYDYFKQKFDGLADES
jgi:hypothetical protein